MSDHRDRKIEGNFALDDNGEKIVPDSKWLCVHHETCLCGGYESDPIVAGTCISGNCGHPAYLHNT